MTSDASPRSLTGFLLVATPALSDSEFAHSVIYLCAHTPEDGAMGLVVNKRLSHPGQDALFDQLGIEPAPSKRRIGVCKGGPVEDERGFVLHSPDWTSDSSVVVDAERTLTASLDILRDIADGSGPRDVLLAIGHASWAPGQLEEELIRHSAWMVAPATQALVFGGDHAGKWRRALASINMDPLTLTGAVGHA